MRRTIVLLASIAVPLLVASTLALVAILVVWPTHRPAQAAGTFNGFRAACYASMPAKVIDPIRHTHHIHEPSGALIFEEDQTYTDLRNVGSNCHNEDRSEAMHDHSSAWSPQLKWDGMLLDQGRTGKYYDSRGVSDPTITEPFPLGMKMVASDDVGNVQWACGGSRDFREHPPQSCPRGSVGLGLMIQFGQCWDGEGIGPDGSHNLAEAVRGKCPASHPHQIPTLTWWPYYPIPADVLANIDGPIEASTDSGWVLADDFMHADMHIGFNTRTLVRQCIRQPARYGKNSKRGMRPDYCDATGVNTSPDAPDEPAVLSTNPADSATGVDPDANITVTFTEKMLGRSINGDTFRLYEGTYTDEDLNSPECPPDQPDCASGAPPLPLGATARMSNADSKVAILNPDGRLAQSTNYTAVLEGTDTFDTFAVKDQVGNEMAADQIWHFGTGPN
jgi:hypothetical protein